jgi:hypothetical protein
MSHELLLYAHRCSGFVQPGTVGVAECVESDPAKSQLETCRNQVVGTNRIGMIGPTVEDNFSIEKMVGGYMGIYGEALQNRNGQQVA